MPLALIIVSHNSARQLTRCLAGVRALSPAPDRLVVVDNASTEAETLALLDTVDDALVLRQSANLGYGAAINVALDALAQDPQPIAYIGCLNPDAYPEPLCFAKLQQVLEAQPALGGAAPLMLSAENPAVIDGAGDVLSISGYAWRRWHGTALASVLPRAGPVFGACAGACLYRAKALAEVGGFDPAYFMYVEDTDLGLRLQRAGWRCWFEPDAIVHHEGSATTGYRSDFSVFYGHRNVLRLLVKNFPLWLLPLALLAQGLATLLLLPRLVMRGQAVVFLRAKGAGIRELPAAIGARRQTKSVLSVGQWLRLLQFWPHFARGAGRKK